MYFIIHIHWPVLLCFTYFIFHMVKSCSGKVSVNSRIVIDSMYLQCGTRFSDKIYVMVESDETFFIMEEPDNIDAMQDHVGH
jgi:hypothetical protein